MKKIIYTICFGILFVAATSYGASILFPFQGGTGIGTVTAGDIGKVLTVSNNAPFTYTLTSGGTGGGHTIQDEGSSLTQRTKLNFVGAGVTVTDGGAGPDDTIVTIPTTDISGLVPYTGASSDLALGAHNLTLTGALASSGSRVSTGYFTNLNVASGGTLTFVSPSSKNVTISQSTISFNDSSGPAKINLIGANMASEDPDKTITLPNATGTVILSTNDATALAATSAGNYNKYLHANASTGALEWSTVAAAGATTALDNLASVAMNAPLQWNNSAAQTLDIAATANTVVGRALTISAGSTVTGGTADMAGGNLTLNAGLGKGTGASSIIFQTGKTLTTGSTLQTLTEAMRITGAGNVGIGTTSPGQVLDVVGNIRLATESTPKLMFGTSNSGTYIARNGSSQDIEVWNSGIKTGTFSQVGGSIFAIGNSNDYSTNATLSTASFGQPLAIYPHIMGNSSRNGANLTLTGGAGSTVGDWNGGNVLIDGGALNGAGTAGNILLGSIRGNVGIGTASPTNILSLGGNAARTFWMERGTVANTAGYGLTIQSGGATAAATDKGAGMLTLAPGLSTGTGFSSIRLQSLSRAASTATADNTLTDRIVIPSQANLTNNSATNLFEVATGTDTASGGIIHFSVNVVDTTNHKVQSYVGTVKYEAHNENGSIAGTITEEGSPVTYLSGGTLTTTWAITAGTGKVTISLNANSSLAAIATEKLEYTIENLSRNAITQL